ncbi:hypothetical protein ACVWYF_003295 [Hymenobacter sp. UYAg731]
MLPLATLYTINLDKLELMLTQPADSNTSIFTTDATTHFSSLTPSTSFDSYCANGVVLERVQCIDRNYHLCYTVTINKLQFGTLLMNRTKLYENENDLVKLKVDNSVLYTDFLPLLNKVLSAFRFEINNITRLEIALDTNTNLLSNFYHYFRDETNYFLKGGVKKLDSITKFAKEYRNGDETPTLYIGKSDKKLKIYNKSLEILETGNHKDYITTFHAANGLDITADVYRMEIALTNTALKRYITQYRHNQTGKVITQYQYEKLCYNNSEQNTSYIKETVKSELLIAAADFTNTTALTSIFKTVLASLCQFKMTDNERINRCTDVNLIDFSAITNVLYNNTITQSKKRDKNKMKNYIKATIRTYQKTSVTSLLTAAYDVAKSEGLLEYYNQVIKELKIKPVSTIGVSESNTVGLFEDYLN